MTLLADLGHLKFHMVVDETVEGTAFPQLQPFGGDVLRKLSVTDLPPGCFFKLPDAFGAEKAHLPVPRTGMGVAFHTVFREVDEGNRGFDRSFLFGDIDRFNY